MNVLLTEVRAMQDGELTLSAGEDLLIAPGDLIVCYARTGRRGVTLNPAFKMTFCPVAA